MNQLILDTLNPINVPVSFQTYSGKSTSYVTFFFFDESPVLHADDKEKQTAFNVQVDIWSKSDYTNLVEEVKQRMKDVGFTRTSAVDLYEQDTKIFHKAIRFSYSKEVL